MNECWIPADIVDRVVKQVLGGDPNAALKRMGPFQPELTGFVLGYTYSHHPNLRALASMATAVAFEAFRAGFHKAKKARERLVHAHWEEAVDAVGELADEFIHPRALINEEVWSSEPELMSALLELAFEDSHGELVLVEDDAWHLLAVLWTVVETLHECAGDPRFEPESTAVATEPRTEPVLALDWYTADQWQQMQDTAEDADPIETYEEWLSTAEAAEAEFRQHALRTERVMIDVERMRKWFADTGRRATAASRAAYAAEVRRGSSS
jgi:hypothetical protein